VSFIGQRCFSHVFNRETRQSAEHMHCRYSSYCSSAYLSLYYRVCSIFSIDEYESIVRLITRVHRYIVYWKQGYQEFQEPRGTSVIKVKGIAKVTGNSSAFYTSKQTHIVSESKQIDIRLSR
jgi:hypothetical protein